MELSRTQIDQYLDEGYLIFRDFFSEREVDAMRLELERLRREGALRNVTTDGDGETRSAARQNLQICPLTPKSTLYRSLAWHPKVLSTVRPLIGDPVIRHLDQSFLKPARSGAPTNWHQDNAYFRIADPLKGVGMWIAIHEATVANGTMHIIPGSHKEVYEHKRDLDSDHHIRCWPDESRAIPVELKPGGVLFFSYGTVHATKENRTNRDRAGVAYHFLNADYAAPKVFTDERNPVPCLTGPRATGGETEFGVRVEGAWPDEVERVLRELAPQTA